MSKDILETAQYVLEKRDLFGSQNCDEHTENCTAYHTHCLIEGLVAEIARLREERRWVPVGERLPGDEEWVDVAGRWGDCLGWHDGEEWRNVEEDPFPSEVTHWRKRGPGPGSEGGGA